MSSRSKSKPNGALRPAAATPPASRPTPGWANAALALLALAAIAVTGLWVWQQTRPEPPITDQLSSASTDSAKRMLEALDRGSVSEAEDIFYNEIHALVHIVDFDLRQKDAAVGEALFNTKTALEGQFQGPRDIATIRDLTRQIQGLLLQAQQVMAGGA